MPMSTIPVKWLNCQSNPYTSRFEVPEPVDSLVRIPPQTGGGLLEDSNDYEKEDKKVVGRVGFEPTTPAMSRRYLV